MLTKFKKMFINIFTSIKNKFNWKKIGKVTVATVAVVGTTFAFFFGFKYFKLKNYTSGLTQLLHETQSALRAVSAQCTQLTLDNSVLSELVGMVLHIPGEIYA